MKQLRRQFSSKPKWMQIIFFSVLGLIAVTALGFLFGYVIMLLWNALMPQIFGLPSIGYWQGIGLFILARILLGGFGGGSKSQESGHKKAKGDLHMNVKSKDSLKAKAEMADSMAKDYEGYEAWWNAEGKTAFEAYKTQKEDKE